MKTVSLEVTQPSTGPVCPGQEIILTCTVVQTSTGQLFTLIWDEPNIIYHSDQPLLLHSFDDFTTTAVLITTNISSSIVSNATLASAVLSNNNSKLSCYSPPQGQAQTATIIIAGTLVCACCITQTFLL